MKTGIFLSLVLVCATSLVTTACSDKAAAKSEATAQPQSTPAPATATKVALTDLVKNDTKVGTGAEATTGKNVVVHYTGWLYDEKEADKKGEQFDSSRDKSTPFEFPLGGGQVIKGWDQGVVGMKVGGQRTLIIPSSYGYGARGAGDVIPPNADLIFEVELLEVK